MSNEMRIDIDAAVDGCVCLTFEGVDFTYQDGKFTFHFGSHNPRGLANVAKVFKDAMICAEKARRFAEKQERKAAVRAAEDQLALRGAT